MQSFLRLVFSSAFPYSHSSLYRAGKTMLLRLREKTPRFISVAKFAFPA